MCQECLLGSQINIGNKMITIWAGRVPWLMTISVDSFIWCHLESISVCFLPNISITSMVNSQYSICVLLLMNWCNKLFRILFILFLNTVYTIYTVYTIQTALHCFNSSMYAYIYCYGTLVWANGLLSKMLGEVWMMGDGRLLWLLNQLWC